jgi:gamma-glutamylcyclotransferase (GGCT)/AIG2-like uncharacterized protein YtfP
VAGAVQERTPVRDHRAAVHRDAAVSPMVIESMPMRGLAIAGRGSHAASMIERLFVYGTLAPGKPNAHVLAGVRGTWEPASVNGRLLAEGWGAALGFPGIVLDDHGEPVRGLVFSSEELAAHWERLDAFEGKGYERVPTTARLDDGSPVEAYIYRLRELPA